MAEHQSGTPTASKHTHATKRWQVTPSSAVLVLGITLIVGYLGGMRHDQVLGVIAPTLGIKVETGSLDLSSVQLTYRQLKANFDGTLNDQALIQGASKGLVAAAGDTHTEYFTKDEAKQFQEMFGKLSNFGNTVGASVQRLQRS